jgi:hypothetical protein
MSDFLPGVSFGLPPAGGPRLSVCLCFYPVRRWDTCPRGKPACSQGKPSSFFYCPARDSRKPSAANRHQLRCGERTRWRVLWILALTDVLVGEQRFALANRSHPWVKNLLGQASPGHAKQREPDDVQVPLDDARTKSEDHQKDTGGMPHDADWGQAATIGLIAPRHRDRTVIL